MYAAEGWGNFWGGSKRIKSFEGGKKKKSHNFDLKENKIFELIFLITTLTLSLEPWLFSSLNRSDLIFMIHSP